MADKTGAETESQKPKTRRSGLTIALAVIAVVGWVAAVWLATLRSSLQEDLTEQVRVAEAAHEEISASLQALENASGELADIQSEIGDETATLSDLRARRESAQGEYETELGQLTAEIAAARRSFELELAQLAAIGEAARGRSRAAEVRLAGLTSQADDRQRELDRERTQLLQIAQRLMTEQAALGLAEHRTKERAQHLAAVGQRLTEVREQSAQAQSTLADITAEAAGLSRELADAERRLQVAREAEASLEERLTSARREFSDMQTRRDDLVAAVEQLRQRREALAADVASAEEQRARVQEQITELTAALAERSHRLQGLESRIAELQQRGAELAAVGQDAAESGGASNAAVQTTAAAAQRQPDEPASLNQASIDPGRYRAGPINANFAEDGTFTIRHTERGETASGHYSLDDGVLSLTEATGDLGDLEFPMRCGVEGLDLGFRLTSHEDSCSRLADMTFVPAGQSR